MSTSKPTQGNRAPHARQQALAIRPAAKRGGIAAMTIVVVLLSLLTPSLADAACVRGMVMCTNMTAMRTCSASLMCSNAPSSDRWSVSNSLANNVTGCAPGAQTLIGATVTFNLTAMAATAAPTSRSCVWYWRSHSFSTTGTVSIETADGLPVELMDFSVDGDADREAKGSDPAA